MNRTAISIPLIALAAALVQACASSQGSTPEEKRDYSLRMRDETLQKFYAQDASLKDRVKNAAGYGTFSNIGTRIIFVATGGGFGVVHNNRTGEDTYMKMGEVGVGLGIGVKDFRALFVFHHEDVLNTFVHSGWEFGAEGDAAAKTGDQGGQAAGAATASTGMDIYQLTENGLVISATVSGTKYWKDDELNRR